MLVTLAALSTLTGVFAAQASAGLGELGTCNSLRDVQVRPAGQIVAVGTTSGCFDYANRQRIVVAQFLANGGLDPSFGEDGIVLLPADLSGPALGFAVTPTGEIVVSTKKALVGLTPAGNLDSGFGTRGLAEMDFGGRSSETTPGASAFTPDHFGNFLLVGTAKDQSTGTSTQFLARYTANGEFDPNFGTYGRVVVDSIPDPDSYLGLETHVKIAVGPDNGIYRATGYCCTGPVITKFTPAGALDTSWGPNSTGKVQMNFSDFNPWADGVSRLAISEDGALSVTGPQVYSVGRTVRATYFGNLTPEGTQWDPLGIGYLADEDESGNRLFIRGPGYGDSRFFQVQGIGLDPGFSGYAKVEIGESGSASRAATFGPNGSAYVVGEANGPSCRHVYDCSSMAIGKFDLATRRLDESFGSDQGISTFPRLKCTGSSQFDGVTLRNQCPVEVPRFHSRARILNFQGQAPWLKLRILLPKGNGAYLSRKVQIGFPKGLRVRPNRLADVFLAKVAYGRLPQSQIHFWPGSVTLDLGARTWAHRRMLRVRIDPGGIKPFSRGHTHDLNFRVGLKYKSYDGRKDQRTETVSARH